MRTLVPIVGAFTTADSGLAAMVATASTPWMAAASAGVALGAVASAIILSVRRQVFS